MEETKLFDDLTKMIQGLIVKNSELEARITKIEAQMEETSAGVYYEHVDKEYVQYIQEGIGKVRRGED